MTNNFDRTKHVRITKGCFHRVFSNENYNRLNMLKREIRDCLILAVSSFSLSSEDEQNKFYSVIFRKSRKNTKWKTDSKALYDTKTTKWKEER